MAKPAAAPLPVTRKPITTKIDLENSLFGNVITTTVGTTTKVPTTLPTTRSSTTTTRSTTTTTWTPTTTSTVPTTSRTTIETWTSTNTQLPGRLFSSLSDTYMQNFQLHFPIGMGSYDHHTKYQNVVFTF